ncbi:MAG: prepilin-type N-terminal cleavage/methylation domain-containing protein [Lentisphaeraceae bacterium]|nr:prepilin-type N-terminal cleavage/methylation domain-containing protein [Lentisphaeraceae bacterium]
MKNHFKKKFTLIELLVVVGIIAILVSILIPSIRNSRAKVRQVSCMANLQQIVQGTILFATDNNGEFPSYKGNSSSWPWGFSDWGIENTDFYAKYLNVKDVYFCAQDLDNSKQSEAAKCYPNFPAKASGAWRVNISYNYFFGRDSWEPSKPNHRGGEIRIHEVTDTAESTILADVMRFGSTDYTIISNWNHKGASSVTAATTGGRGVGGNMGYADGHVAWMTGSNKLLMHRQKMKSNDQKSYAAQQPGDI